MVAWHWASTLKASGQRSSISRASFARAAALAGSVDTKPVAFRALNAAALASGLTWSLKIATVFIIITAVFN